MTCSPGSASYLLMQTPSTESPTWADADVFDLISDNRVAVDSFEGGDFLKGTRESDISTVIQTQQNLAGDIVIPFSEKAFEFLLPLALGPLSTDTWKYTAGSDPALPDLIILTRKGGVISSRSTGNKIAQLGIFHGGRGLVYLRLTVIGKKEFEDNGGAIPTFDADVYPATAKPVSTASVAHSLNSSSIGIREAEITINNALDTDSLNSLYLTDICEQDLIPTFRYNSKAGDLASRYVSVAAGIAASCAITVPSGSVYTISTTRLVHGHSPVPVVGRTTVQMELEGRAYADIANTEPSIKVVKT